MQGRVNPAYVELEELNLKAVIEHFCHGSGIVFITEHGKLVGGMTEGDIRRSFRMGCQNINAATINHKISYIVESDEESQTYCKAERIFKENDKILNIPVVNANGILLYQIDRRENLLFEGVMEHLTEIRIHQSLPAFLECYQRKRIILTGGERSVLDATKSFFLGEAEGNTIDISIIESLDECKNLLGNHTIVCLSDIAVFYLRKIISVNVPVVSIKEIRKYSFYKKLSQVHMKVIANFLEVFGYNRLCFYTSNKYVSQIIYRAKDWGIAIDKENSSDSDRYIFETDIVAYSRDGENKEKIPLEIFYQSLQGIRNYFYIAKKPLIKGQNIQEAVLSAAYKLLKSYCSHVYIHRISNEKYKLKKFIHTNRVIENFVKSEKFFSSKFLENMYGDNDFPIKQLWSDTLGCPVVKINEGYWKYQSNYTSTFFNTDLYGRRITTDVPQDYDGTIWLLGNCTYAGYAVPDHDTVASMLQRKVNGLGKKYRVVNLGMAGTNFWDSIDAIADFEIGKYDIVVCWVESTWGDAEDNNVITTDFYTLISQMGKDDYWDSPWHCGAKGYSMIADQILEKIMPDLHSRTNRRFCLDDDLEKEVKTYLSNHVQEAESKFKTFAKRSVKTGAIVMNCNPFTYGHLYLAELASRLVDVLYIFVVEEDKSFFSFADRFYMVQEGVKDIKNILVLPSGKFMISSLTFSGYFMKERPECDCLDSFLDLKIFAYYIAPAFGITVRFVGEEPFDRVTAQYNRDMKIILGEQAIDVLEIPRKRTLEKHEIISATKVRSLMQKRNYDDLKGYVPESTIKCLQEKYSSFGN